MVINWIKLSSSFVSQVDIIRSFSSDPELIQFTELFCHNTSSNEKVTNFSHIVPVS
jgi:hypothetical protein